MASDLEEMIIKIGSKHLCISFEYHGKERVVEPYSFRLPKTGNILFYGWERQDNRIKSYKIDDMKNVISTNEKYIPRFTVEFV